MVFGCGVTTLGGAVSGCTADCDDWEVSGVGGTEMRLLHSGRSKRIDESGNRCPVSDDAKRRRFLIGDNTVSSDSTSVWRGEGVGWGV